MPSIAWVSNQPQIRRPGGDGCIREREVSEWVQEWKGGLSVLWGLRREDPVRHAGVGRRTKHSMGDAGVAT